MNSKTTFLLLPQNTGRCTKLPALTGSSFWYVLTIFPLFSILVPWLLHQLSLSLYFYPIFSFDQGFLTRRQLIKELQFLKEKWKITGYSDENALSYADYSRLDRFRAVVTWRSGTEAASSSVTLSPQRVIILRLFGTWWLLPVVRSTVQMCISHFNSVGTVHAFR